MKTKRKTDPNRLIVILTTEQRAALSKIKEETGVPIAFQIRQAVDKFLEERKKS